MTLLRRNAFRIGFAVGLAACVLLNYLSYRNNVCSQFIDDCGCRFGVPAPLFEEGGFAHFWGILWLGLTVDIFFAVTSGVLIGRIFQRAERRFAATQT